MTSTERRHERNRDLVATSRIRSGDRVTVRRDNGAVSRTVACSDPFLLDGTHALIVVDGIPGNTNLARVTRGWKAR